MKIENQYCNRQQALRLKELGVLNETKIDDPAGDRDDNGKLYKVPNVGCYYSCDVDGRELKGILGEQEDAPYDMYNPVKLYSVAELGCMLPDMLETHLQYEFVTIKEDDCWICRYVRGNDVTDQHPTANSVGAENEATARAAILIDLLEKKLTTPEEVNKRLTKS